MKKSASAQIITLAVIAFILFCVIAARFDSQQNQIDQLKQPQQIVKVELVKVDGAMVERLEELARLNLLLEQENEDLKHQAKEFGWLKTAMDKEGVNP
jgi:hypothetical protein